MQSLKAQIWAFDLWSIFNFDIDQFLNLSLQASTCLHLWLIFYLYLCFRTFVATLFGHVVAPTTGESPSHCQCLQRSSHVSLHPCIVHLGLHQIPPICKKIYFPSFHLFLVIFHLRRTTSSCCSSCSSPLWNLCSHCKPFACCLKPSPLTLVSL